MIREAGLAELDITTLGVFLAQGFPQGIRVINGHRPVQPVLDFMLDGIRQFLAVGGKEFDAIVVIGIMRSGNDNPGTGMKGTGQMRHGRGGHGAEQTDVHPGGGEARLQGGLQQIA